MKKTSRLENYVETKRFQHSDITFLHIHEILRFRDKNGIS